MTKHSHHPPIYLLLYYSSAVNLYIFFCTDMMAGNFFFKLLIWTWECSAITFWFHCKIQKPFENHKWKKSRVTLRPHMCVRTLLEIKWQTATKWFIILLIIIKSINLGILQLLRKENIKSHNLSKFPVHKHHTYHERKKF